MVSLSMSHRYGTGTLVELGVTARCDPKRLCRPRSYQTARIEIHGKVVDAVVEDRHIDAFERATAIKGVGCSILMELDGAFGEWTVHHVNDSTTWEALAEPRIKPILMSWERREQRKRAA